MNGHNKVYPNDSSITETVLSTQKRNHKHKHHHHHHTGKRHHYHHHHNRQHRNKNVEQQPMIVYRDVSNNKGYSVDANTYANVPHGTDDETTFIDDQQTPLVIYRDAGVQQSIATDRISQPLIVNPNQETVSE